MATTTTAKPYTMCLDGEGGEIMVLTRGGSREKGMKVVWFTLFGCFENGIKLGGQKWKSQT